ncbi:DUF3488 and transglutaminase-like domain-containing protein [Amphritea sp. 1_MG-2023]|uniref:transglutaminase TgpA family protein n=1 Tax=Amphritea sp. 1_MG-2023 TaxID=3062670 RepID=UPI0026E33B61|nr:DUF3488 and transglutaminase-like domain-containing protein [Amphritea sp. 1_MG-2023]MDO6564581.1 DUF3488 and transglutaminase-like domain-containing protein [Amphritea sp. 1_MG-2023]
MMPLFQLTRSSMIWLLVSILMVMAPYITVVPSWLFLLALLTIGWRLMVHSGRWSFPHWSVRLALMLLVLIGLIAELRQNTMMVVTVGLLISAFLLKLTEMYRRRDALVVIYAAFLLIVCSFLFDQSIPMALYAVGSLIVVTASLNTVFRSQQNNDIWRPLKRSAVLYLQALPMMLILFLIFPRIGPLWQVDMNAGQSFTGLSDSMSPGDVSQLTRSADIAFRVRFDEPLPAEKLRYWRGLTYDQFDGRRWRRSDRPREADRQRSLMPQYQGVEGPSTNVESFSYLLTMEASGQRWRYGLDVPVNYPGKFRQLDDLTLQAGQRLMQRQQYRLMSRVGPIPETLSAKDVARYLQLPAQGNAQSRELALTWAAQYSEAKDVSAQMLRFFATDFRYTLEPPLLGQTDAIDQFLFQTQRGFCGHFASAGVMLLRAAGIPARVVGGYLGGELNPLDGALTVRQYEAHAWLEYWDKSDASWHRLDPTAVVAPSRLAQSAAQLFSTEPTFLADAMLMRNGFLSDSLLKQIRLRYEAINYDWHRWVLNFHERQSGFLQQLLGDISVLKILLLIMFPGALVLSWVAFSLLRHRGARKDKLLEALEQLDKRLITANLQRRQGEAMRSFFARLTPALPALASEFEILSRCYEQICYAQDADPELRRQFKASIDRCCERLPKLHPVEAGAQGVTDGT